MQSIASKTQYQIIYDHAYLLEDYNICSESRLSYLFPFILGFVQSSFAAT